MKLKTIKKIIIPSLITMSIISGVIFYNNKKTLQAEKSTSIDTEQINTQETQTKIQETIQTEPQIIQIEPKESKETQETLANTKYDILDSHKIINVNYTDSEIPTNLADATSDIIISNAYLVTTTGTKNFDANNKPGYDSSPTNDIVRTYDQIIYNLNFSIQNISDKNYSNFKYRITSTLDDAIIDDKINSPEVRASIINGSYIAKEDGTGYYAEGITESVLATNGQATIPISINILDNDNGATIIPRFKIELLSAIDKKTGEEIEINKVYDKTNMPRMEAPITYVSSMPSVKVQMIQGSSGENLLVDASKRGYDVGIDTMLSPIPTRGPSDYRGAAMPKGKITYTIKTKGTYTEEDGTIKNLSNDQFNPFEVVDYCGPSLDRTAANWTNGGTAIRMNQMKTLNAPQAYAKGIYLAPATTKSIPPSTERGVYDSGDFNVSQNSYDLNVTNENYERVINPYMYDMTGNRMTEVITFNLAYDKTFTSLENVFSWDYTKTNNIGINNDWSRYDMTLYIDEVSYDGYTNKVDTSVTYSSLLKQDTAWYRTAPAIGTYANPSNYTAAGTEKFTYANANSGVPGTLSVNYGNARLYHGQKAMLSDYAFADNETISSNIKQSEFIITWDPTGFIYDSNPGRLTYATAYSMINSKHTYKYGVAIDASTAPFTTMKVGTVDNMLSLYTWYDTEEEAKANGDISAVNCITSFDEKNPTTGSLENCIQVPVIVNATTGSKTEAGNPLVVLGAHKYTNKNGSIAAQTIESGKENINGNPISGIGTYGPTDYNTDGTVKKYNMVYSNFIGESAWVQGFGITSYMSVDKSSYETTDLIKYKLGAHISGGTDATYSSSLKTTLPKGISYVKGTSYDVEGNLISDPTVTLNAKGEYELTYLLPENNNINQDYEIKFTAKAKASELEFNATGVTDSLNTSTIGEVWLSDHPEVRDTRDEKFRRSATSYVETLKQQVTVRKTHNKEAIEIGEDNQFGTTNTSITYNISMINSKLESVENTKVVDVLPYNGDSRGSKINGGIKITNIEPDEDNKDLDIYYTTTKQSDKLDPKTIDLSKYKKYIYGITPISDIEDAKAIVFTKDKIDINEEISINITIKPQDSKAGDILINNANMNSDLDMLITSEKTETTVYARSYSGVAWYDTNKDGLINDSENKYENMPVKLYRQTTENGIETNTLVEHDLKGNKFINSTGDSLIKTDSNGNYKFENIPEGDYYAVFEIQNEINSQDLIVTEPNVGGSANTKINSKAAVENATTPAYNLPSLNSISQLNDLTNATYELPNINIGVYKNLGDVTIFKYEEGTAKDEDGDGKLSNEEKAKGKPLNNVTFELYNNKNEKIDEGKTDSNGYLTFENLEKGDYYIIETTTNEGYELSKIKHPFTIKNDSTHIELFISNSKTSNLPFTGNTATTLIIICSSIVLILSIFIFIKQFKTNNNRKEAIPRKK